MNRPQSAKAIAKARTDQMDRLKRWVFGSALFVGGVIVAGSVFADSHENITVSHGWNEYGDLKYTADFPHLDYVNPDAPIGGEMSIATRGTFDNMNPWATLSGSPGIYSSIMWETLMTSTSDEIGSSYCLLCTTIEYPDDKAWVIFNLRDDVTFSDGSPMTANDVIKSHEIYREQATPSFRQGIVSLVAKYEALDDYTVKFTFAEDAPIRGRIGQMGVMPVMSAAWFAETGARIDEPSMETSPGTGEYMIGSVDPGRQIIYTRNPDYWGEDVPINVGRGNYDSIRVEYFADSSASFEAFKTGEFTFQRETSSIKWATAYDFPAFNNEWVVKEALEGGDLPLASGFVFNMRDPKFADRRVREAIGLMFNFNWTNENLQYGLFKQRESFWESDRLKAVGVPEGQELEILESLGDLIDPAILTEEVRTPHVSGDRPLDRGNLRKALALMEEAGWTPGDDGMLRNAAGETLDVEFMETRQSFDRIIMPYIENIERLGVNITYNRIDGAQFQARRQDHDWEMMYWYYNNGLLEGRGFGQRYSCEDKDDVFNITGYCSEAIDEIANRLANFDDYDEMVSLVTAADRILRHEHFLIPSWYQNQVWLAYYDMYEYPENLPEFGVGAGYLDYWWYNAEKGDALRAAGAIK